MVKKSLTSKHNNKKKYLIGFNNVSNFICFPQWTSKETSTCLVCRRADVRGSVCRSSTQWITTTRPAPTITEWRPRLTWKRNAWALWLRRAVTPHRRVVARRLHRATPARRPAFRPRLTVCRVLRPTETVVTSYEVWPPSTRMPILASEWYFTYICITIIWYIYYDSFYWIVANLYRNTLITYVNISKKHLYASPWSV